MTTAKELIISSYRPMKGLSQVGGTEGGAAVVIAVVFEDPCEGVKAGLGLTQVRVEQGPGCGNYRPRHRDSDALISPPCSQLFLVQYLMSSQRWPHLLYICVLAAW